MHLSVTGDLRMMPCSDTRLRSSRGRAPRHHALNLSSDGRAGGGDGGCTGSGWGCMRDQVRPGRRRGTHSGRREHGAAQAFTAQDWPAEAGSRSAEHAHRMEGRRAELAGRDVPEGDECRKPGHVCAGMISQRWPGWRPSAFGRLSRARNPQLRSPGPDEFAPWVGVLQQVVLSLR